MSEEQLPPGVTRHWHKFKAQYWHEGRRYYCGLHNTAETAVAAINEDRQMKCITANPVGRPKKNPD